MKKIRQSAPDSSILSTIVQMLQLVLVVIFESTFFFILIQAVISEVNSDIAEALSLWPKPEQRNVVAFPFVPKGKIALGSADQMTSSVGMV